MWVGSGPIYSNELAPVHLRNREGDDDEDDDWTDETAQPDKRTKIVNAYLSTPWQAWRYLLQRFQVLWVDPVDEVCLRAYIVVALVFDKAHACVVRGLCNKEQGRNTEAF